jgi:hypothetical protein
LGEASNGTRFTPSFEKISGSKFQRTPDSMAVSLPFFHSRKESRVKMLLVSSFNAVYEDGISININ